MSLQVLKPLLSVNSTIPLSTSSEKKEKATILLQNAEISQELSILKQELKNETAEVAELNESNQKLLQSMHEW